MANVKAYWLASLSDGSTVIENKGDYQEIEGELSPYLRLRRNCVINKLHITTIRIQVKIDDLPVRTFNLPSLSPKAKWINKKPLLPIGFDYFRTVEQDMTTDPTEEGLNITATPNGYKRYIEIHAYYDDFKLVTIVDEDEGNESWSLIIQNEKGVIK